jgi:hypothetical protein
MTSYTNCKVGDVQSVIVQIGDEGLGYGFSILGGPHGRPLVTLAFKTEVDAEQARTEVAKVVATAVEITPHG